jgi:hypothetical protein
MKEKSMDKKKDTLLAVRVEPWQLFKFRKIVKFKGMRPGVVIMEALQMYAGMLNISKETMDNWLKEYHKGGKGCG